MVDQLVTLLLNGISLAMILILISLGLAIIFGLMGVVNLAHGELFIVGAYTVFAANELTSSVWVGILLAPITGAVIGLVMERSVIRHLYDRPIETLLATWGFSVLIRQLIRLFIGYGFKTAPTPLPGDVSLFGVSYPAYRLFIIVATSLVMLATFYIIFRTDFGLKVLAVIQNREMAQALGINTSHIYRWAFAFGASLAALAGALMVPIIPLEPEAGLGFLGRSFIVVIVGGVGSLLGVLGGGFVIGGAETVFSYLTTPFLSHAIVLILCIIIIRFRPQGLFRA